MSSCGQKCHGLDTSCVAHENDATPKAQKTSVMPLAQFIEKRIAELDRQIADEIDAITARRGSKDDSATARQPAL